MQRSLLQLLFEKNTRGCIIENGIGSPKKKCNQVNNNLRRIVSEITGDLYNSQITKKIFFYTGIATWNQSSAIVKGEIEKANINFAINLEKLPKLEDENIIDLTYQVSKAISKLRMKPDHTKKIRELLASINEEGNTELYKIITTQEINKNSLGNDLSGRIAELMMMYFISSSAEGIHLLPHVKFRERKIELRNNQVNYGYDNEIDFFLSFASGTKLYNMLGKMDAQIIYNHDRPRILKVDELLS